MNSPRWWLHVLAGLVRRPRLWGTAVSQTFRLARPGWWRRAPFLPLPDADYLRFRLETQYGSDRSPEPGDVITYLHWCHQYTAAA
ncbi:MAG: hypothetical protein ABIP03_08590 [Aquihabitans sp.]